MDLSVLKGRLSALQNPRGGQKRDLSQTLWRPTVGKHSVRIVPSMFNKQNPFKEVLMHYGINNKLARGGRVAHTPARSLKRAVL
jgi:hypothetical protein